MRFTQVGKKQPANKQGVKTRKQDANKAKKKRGNKRASMKAGTKMGKKKRKKKKMKKTSATEEIGFC